MTRRPNRRRDRRSHAPRAFTLMEIIVVVTIIALLGGLVAPRLLGQIGKNKVKIAQTETASLRQQVSIYLAEQGLSRVPDDFDLETLATGDDRVINPDDLIDPWGNPYVIVVPGEMNPDFDVLSFGADGEAGGEGEDADVRS